MVHNILFIMWCPPKTLVSDNGPQFGSKQFEDWCRLNGIVHLTSAPFHLPSNGDAERLVGIFKTAMQRSVGEEGKEKDKATIDFLREYRSTPHSTTGRTSAELMIGRQVQTPLSLMQPSMHRDKKPPLHSAKFAIGDHVFIRSYGGNQKVKWIPAVCRRHTSPSRRSDASPGEVFAHALFKRFSNELHLHHVRQYVDIRRGTTLLRLLKTAESLLHLETWLLHQCFVGAAATVVPLRVTPPTG